MRYTLDNNGYIKTVAWGCMTGNCAEYTGAIPAGYTSLPDWADRACINAYYLDSNGNLVLDAERQNLLQTKYEREAIDYAPVLHKDLYETNEIIDAQYKKNNITGVINIINNARSLAPMIKLAGLSQGKINVFASTKNMLPLTAITETKGGISFTVGNGITISGTATEDVVYSLLDSDKPAFAMLKGHNYYLSLGGLECELLYEEETTEQVYVGASGLINLSENKTVNKVLIKIPAGTTVNKTIYPTLAYGSEATDYEEAKVKAYTVDLSEHEIAAADYVLIGEGLAVLYGANTHVVGEGSMGLLNGYNMIYTSQANSMEVQYTTNEFLVDDMAFLQGTSTTSGRFVIKDDGSIQATGGVFNGEVICTKLVVGSGAQVEGLDTGGITAAQATEITKNTIATQRITASDLHITGGSINMMTGDVEDAAIMLQYDPGDYYGNRQTMLTANGLIVKNDYNYVRIDGEGVTTDALYTNAIFLGGSSLSSLFAGASHSHSEYYGYGDYATFGRIYSTGQLSVDGSTFLHTLPSLSSSPTAMYFNSGGQLGYSGSSRRWKKDIEDVKDASLDPTKLYDLPVRQFRYDPEYYTDLKEDNPLLVGFIAEEVDEIFPQACRYDNEGLPMTWEARDLLPAMLSLLQQQKKEIDQLKLDIEALKGGK